VLPQLRILEWAGEGRPPPWWGAAQPREAVASRNGLGWKGLYSSSNSNPLLWAGSPSSSPGCSEPHPAWP